ncbi:hypothetical protein OG819_55315 [Streptomyces sp. NBC_01549]|uniref:hypothetical protein n=1 Tax=Streptomyces sp. NBC_01549 TaxID=2975874 RepID=UPI00225AED45|nr:hypothetical protein [Streptomyces sp. NBC_01549]MCX4598328.1 hypothetical protein [Streptomyces sp. NBC_01549]
MSSTDLTPVTILTAATDLVRQRAAHLGSEPAPAGPVTVVLDDAADLLTDPADRDLLTELATSGRAVGIRVQLRSRLHRQYATLAELNDAANRGEW